MAILLAKELLGTAPALLAKLKGCFCGPVAIDGSAGRDYVEQLLRARRLRPDAMWYVAVHPAPPMKKLQIATAEGCRQKGSNREHAWFVCGQC